MAGLLHRLFLRNKRNLFRSVKSREEADSTLLANLYLHVVFDKWMEKNHPEKRFERYADDLIVHCKTEKQTLFMLKEIEQRMQIGKLELHPLKTKNSKPTGILGREIRKEI